ncbi:MAG: glycosyltransferase [bacterium]|nr:glycosyltransferase [bacterium]
MKIAIVSSRASGGAGLAALRLHQGLLEHGTDSTFVNLQHIDAAMRMERPRILYRCIPAAYFKRVLRLIRSRLARERLSDRVYENFSDFISPRATCYDLDLASYSAINLHWTNGLVDIPGLYRVLPKNIPLIFTLHDMNLFTGGCHYTMQCERFASGCGACPALNSNRFRDRSRRNFVAKQKFFGSVPSERAHIVTLCKWMAEEVARSPILQRFESTQIVNGLNSDAFKPVDKQSARKSLGLDTCAPTILFISDVITNFRKGFDLFCEALPLIKQTIPHLQAISVGKDASFEKHLPIRPLGSLDNEISLSQAYSAADLFVIPSRQDNLPNCVVESLYCGTPVCGFEIGGLPDMISHGKNGWLSKDISGQGLAIVVLESLNWLTKNRFDYVTCRNQAMQRYSLSAQASAYRNLFERVVGKHGTPADPAI